MNDKQKHLELLIQDGNTFIAEGEIHKAIAIARKCIELDNNNLDAWNLLGNSERKWGNQNKSIDAFNKALQIDPGHDRTYYNRGLVYRDLGQVKKAIIDFERALSIRPRTAAYHNALAECANSLGDTLKAIDEYESCHDIDSQNINYRNKLARLYLELSTASWVDDSGQKLATTYEEIQEAKFYSRKATELHPDDSEVLQREKNLAKQIKSLEKRRFIGRKRWGLIAIIAGLALFLSNWNWLPILGVVLLISGVAYYFALRFPNYDINKRSYYPQNRTRFDKIATHLYGGGIGSNSYTLPSFFRFVVGLWSFFVPLLLLPVFVTWALFENYDLLDFIRLETSRLRTFVRDKLFDDPLLLLIKRA